MSSLQQPPHKRFKTLAQIDSKTKQIDEILNGFSSQSLSFIPPSINNNINSITKKQLCKNDKNMIETTVTITNTSMTISHESPTNNMDTDINMIEKNASVTPPLPPQHSYPLKLSPLPALNAKPKKSCLKKSNPKKKRKKITFHQNVKTEDGNSAKFYSSSQYMIRDPNGNFLRSKSKAQIANEKRLLRMLGAPQWLAHKQLPPGLLDENTTEIYDPSVPNDYNAFVDSRHKLQEWIHYKEIQRQAAYDRAMLASEFAQTQLDFIRKQKQRERSKKREKSIDYKKERSRNSRNRNRKRERKNDERYHRYGREKDRLALKHDLYFQSNHRPMPTQSPLEAMNIKEEDTKMSGIHKAMKMMEKHGWKEGEGLGKSNQGLRGCLVPVMSDNCGYNQLMSQLDPTCVLLLQNMANRGAVDQHLRSETIEECQKFGNVLDCVIYESNKMGISQEQEVSVFVHFEHVQSCMQALHTFNGRFFAKRRVVASYFPEYRFTQKDFGSS